MDEYASSGVIGTAFTPMNTTERLQLAILLELRAINAKLNGINATISSLPPPSSAGQRDGSPKPAHAPATLPAPRRGRPPGKK